MAVVIYRSVMGEVCLSSELPTYDKNEIMGGKAVKGQHYTSYVNLIAFGTESHQSVKL